ncbi:hypothetical protein HGRIS_008451 [Hohenbuehelia grisea]|uniref:RRM Nup35-type domain-containing protein n=1 Tax=Hohenbuehelia grisea TaxID=104357 RepID=A0ABR3J8G2_9AGAR
MATSLSGLSASVTRILYLTGFPKELKTKDIQSAFSEWEGVNGGFKIKWRDDTSLLIVFQDATVAKRAYLHTIAFSPPVLTSPDGASAVIRPYDGPDAQAVIQTVNSRGQHNSNPSRAHNGRSNSISVFPTRGGATASLNGNTLRNGQNAAQHITIPDHNPSNGRESSPTLPSLPSQPTLNALINSSLTDTLPSDPAIVAVSTQPEVMGGPRIGDPGKRMLGAALGVRHPSLGPRMVNGGNVAAQGGVDSTLRDMQRAMGGLVVAE